MYDSTTTVTVGLDVHARSIRVAAVRADELLAERTLPYDEEAVERVLRRWPAVRCCYEAGPTGFGLYRYLVDRGIDCWVVAPGLVPQRPGDRVKTDSRDARKLARLLAGGLLEPIHVPSRQLVARLRCLRGVDTLTALALAAEIGDFNRFESAEEFMAFVGLVPTERSSGDQRRQGSITKVGNSHVRRLLVESAWHARRHPKVGYDLARRQRGHDAAVIERSWRCQQRLYQRWQRMAGRGKPQQKIVVACARELAGFVWAIATDQPLRTT